MILHMILNAPHKKNFAYGAYLTHWLCLKGGAMGCLSRHLYGKRIETDSGSYAHKSPTYLLAINIAVGNPPGTYLLDWL